MCEQCSAATKTYGEVVPHWWLIQATKDGNMMKTNDFGLVWINDPDYVWPGDLVPSKDPAYEFTDEQFDNMTTEEGDKWEDWLENVEKLEKHFKSDPGTGFDLVTACNDAGYDPEKHGYRLMSWLSHRMAIVMERNPTADEKIADKFDLEDEAEWGYTRDNVGNVIRAKRTLQPKESEDGE